MKTRITHPLFAWLPGLVLMLFMAGCATTQVDVTWSNPEFTPAKLTGKVLVAGLARDPVLRRIYEDELAARLATRGIATVKSYTVVDGVPGDDGGRRILAAARAEGVTTVLTSAVVGHEHVTQVNIDEPAGRWAGQFEGWYRYYWPYVNPRVEVRTIQRYFASTTLIDVASGKLRWTVRTHTDATGRAERDTRDFAGVIAGALEKNGLL